MKRLLFLVLVLMLAGFYVGWPAWSGYQISQALKTHDSDTLERKIDFPSVRVGIRPIVASEVDKALDRMQRDTTSITGALAAALRKDVAPRIVDAALHTFVTPDNVVKMVQRGGSVRDFVRQSIAEQTGRRGGRAAPPTDASASTEPDHARRPRGLAGVMDRLGRPDSQGGRDEPPPSTTTTMPATPPPPAPAAPPVASAPPAATAPTSAPPPPAEASATADIMRRPRYSYSNIKHFRITGPLSFEIGFNRREDAVEPEVIAEMAFRGGDWKVIRVIPRVEP